MKILLTAFEPFGGMNTNSSLEVLKKINVDFKVILPVSYKRTREELKKAIDLYKPDFVLCLGQAGGETKIRLEKFGLNYQRASIADNDGILLKGNKINSKGSLAYESNINIEKLNDELNKTIDSYISLSAGGYICNTTYYSALEYMNENALFIHLPYYKGQQIESKNEMELDSMVEAINQVILWLSTNVDKK